LCGKTAGVQVPKALHIINGDFYAGAERVQDLLAQRLPAFGYEVGFVCLKRGLFAEARQTRSSPVHLVPMASRFSLGAGLAVARLAEHEGYAILHTHTPRSVLAGCIASLKSGKPLVHHVHSPALHDTESRGRNFVNAAAENLAARRARKVIAVSASLKAYFQRAGFAESRIAVIPNGVAVIKTQSPWQAPQVTWVLGTVAFFRPRKGIDVLLAALAALRGRGIDARLRAVGAFETEAYERQIKGLAQSLEIAPFVEWTGFTRDVAAELRRMDIFVLPSLFGEGLPMVILEAMAYGLPVVSTNVEGIPDALDHGKAGVVVDAGSAEALTETLQQLIANPAKAQQLSATGQMRQREIFSDVAMARGVAQIYREIGI
jgi:glycosyltransferase involved in cell wall biosynthesis